MIERQFVDLCADPSVGPRVTHLTDATAPQWSGIVRLPHRDSFALSGTSRQDLYVVRGSVRGADGTRLATGDFVSRCESGHVTAEDEPAVLFAYRETPSPASAPRRLPWKALQWHAARAPLMEAATLSDDGHRVSVVRWRPGARVQPHSHLHGEEIFVLEGELRSGDGLYPAGTWLRLHKDSTHAPYVTRPTLILLRNGHLRAPVAP